MKNTEKLSRIIKAIESLEASRQYGIQYAQALDMLYKALKSIVKREIITNRSKEIVC